MKAGKLEMPKLPTKSWLLFALNPLKIIVRIFLRYLRASADSCGHFGMHSYLLALLGAEILSFKEIPSEKKILKNAQK